MTVNNLPFVCSHYDCVFYDQSTELCCFCTENEKQLKYDNPETNITQNQR